MNMEGHDMECEGLKVKVTAETYKRMRAYVKLCTQEISGFGIVNLTEEGFLITDAFLIKQKVTGASTEMDPQALFDAVQDEAALGKDTSAWGCWFHSHVDMDAFMSARDLRTIEMLSAETPLISIVMNKRGEYECRVDFYKPFRMTVTGVELEVVNEPTDAMVEECRKEMEEKVTLLEGKFMSMAKKGQAETLRSDTPSFFDSETAPRRLTDSIPGLVETPGDRRGFPSDD